MDEFCPRGETRREMRDICENEDGAKVAPYMGIGGSHSQVTLGPVFEELDKEAEADKVRVKRVRFAEEEQLVETRERQKVNETCGVGKGKGDRIKRCT